MSEEDDANLKEWIESRPKRVQDAIRLRPPRVTWRLNGDKCVIYSYEEPLQWDAPVTVKVIVEANSVLPIRMVFGVALEDLEPDVYD